MHQFRGQGLPFINRDFRSKKNHILAIAIDEYSGGQRQLNHPVDDCEKIINLLTQQ